MALGLHLLIFMALVFQEQLIFRGKEVSDAYRFKILVPHKEYIWKDSTDTDFVQLYNAIYYPRNEVKGHIFYLHGAGRNVEYHTQFIPYFTDRGYAVWMMDYRGFGKSRGKVTEENLADDARNMYDQFLEQFNIESEEAIIVGKDLGTGLATRLAAERQPEKLALIAPFYNLSGLYKDYVPWFPFHLFLNYTFNNNEYIRQYKGEVAIFYGANDMFIPARNSRRLQSLLDTGDEYHEYTVKSVESVVDLPDYQNDMGMFLKK